jgi:hypothetical protein
MAALLPERWFETSPWEHNRLDVIDCTALMQIGGHKSYAERTGAPLERARISQAEFEHTTHDLAELLTNPEISRLPRIERALRSYWLLGNELTLLRDAEDEFRAIKPKLLAGVTAVLFSHPLWWVTEAASSVLASVAEISESAQQVVSRLFDDRRWRVRLGAAEAAFDMRHLGLGNIYAQSIDASWQDENPRIRGLCAENLIANILEKSQWSERTLLLDDHRKHLSHWFADDDCWVLEHPYRLVQTFREGLKATGDLSACRIANAKLDSIMEMATRTNGALLDSKDYWEKEDRTTFLRTIEGSKKKRSLG